MPATRQLAAILFADIQGYTALMQDDEVKAMVVRDKFQKVLTNEIKAHNGRIIHLNGDGALCIFKSAIEAIRAAIEIQKQMREEPNVPLRIGIHSGDVITEGKNVYGDGVNVASRIESFAVAGSVFISGKVFDEIKNHKEIEAVSLGRFELKNVNEPMEIFAISNSGLVVPSKQKLEGKGRGASKRKISSKKNLVVLASVVLIFVAAIFLYNKFFAAPKFTGKEKSIAVLPFTNMSDDKDNEYFSDGITEDIITRLSQITGLKVIARTSVMRFKNSTESIKQIASDLGVSAILEGAVQKIGNNVRISAQLIDAGTEENLWADKYDRELKDIFQLQSDVSEVIAFHLNASLTELLKSRIEKKPTENLEAYNLYLQGNYLWNKHTKESLVEAFNLYSKAIALDSNFAQAYAAKVITTMSRISDEFRGDSVVELMRFNAERALALDPNLAIVHTALGEYYMVRNENLSAAMTEFDKAIELDPNYAHAWSYKSFLYYSNGEYDKALLYASQAVILDPLSPQRINDKARILAIVGKTNEAIELIKKAETLEPNLFYLPNSKLGIYFTAGEFDTWMQLAEDYYKSNAIGRYEYLSAKSVYYAVKGDELKSKIMTDSCVNFTGSNELFLNAACQYLLNEKEKAFATMRDGIAQVPYRQRVYFMETIFQSSFLVPMCADSRFDEIKKLLGWKPLP